VNWASIDETEREEEREKEGRGKVAASHQD
jgi:hypothetical protein